MLLSQLAKNGKIIGKDASFKKITHLCYQVDEDTAFICLDKESVTSKENISNAIKQGAKVIISSFYVNEQITCFVTENLRENYSLIASKLFKFNQEKVKIIGVVGTNGKTTTVKMLAEILRYSGKKVGVISTHKAYYNNKEIVTDMTTPDPPQLFSIIQEMTKHGIEYIVMEVSAHAIFFKKCEPIKFEHLIFTNLSQDHLDFFKDYQEYKKVKKSIFNKEQCKNMVVNSDDDLGIEILNSQNCITYGLNNPADIFAINVKEEKLGIKFIINAYDEIKTVKLKLTGYFNVYNFLACVAVCIKEKINLNNIVEYAKNISSIEGRLEYLGKHKGDIYIDYAHTPIGLKNVLKSLKNVCNNRLFCLFGCGGNRDKSKRKLMGEVSANIADYTIITTDNPRYEEPYDILLQIENGIKKITKNYIIIQDRFLAIKYAIQSLKEGDILIVAGKGDEDYQEIMGQKIFFSDKRAIKSVIEKNV